MLDRFKASKTRPVRVVRPVVFLPLPEIFISAMRHRRTGGHHLSCQAGPLQGDGLVQVPP